MLLVTVWSNLYPQWSLDTDRDFVTMQLDLSASIVTAAFGFGSTTGF